jgi:multiple antibiotic resistance protein
MLNQIQITAFTYAALFPVINPLAGAMIFLNLTKGLPAPLLARLSKKIGFNTFFLLFIALLSGAWILRFFGITIPIVQIGGGLVVASLAWQVLHQPVVDKPDNALININDKAINEMAFFPLTMPLTAGPGSIAVTLTVGAHEMHKHLIDTVMGQIAATGGIVLMAMTVWICYRYADQITKRLGESGSRVIMRLFVFINLCIGLQIIWNGIQGLLANFTTIVY